MRRPPFEVYLYLQKCHPMDKQEKDTYEQELLQLFNIISVQYLMSR